MKKVFTLMITLLSLFVLFACDNVNQDDLNKLKTYADNFTFDTSLTNDKLNIPNVATITDLGEIQILFESSNKSVIDETGTVKRTQNDEEVTITVYFKYSKLQEIRTFIITVNKQTNNLIKYTITFNSDGGTIIDELTIDSGTKVIKPIDPEKSGYNFLGWFLNDLEFNFDTIIHSNIELIAKWEQQNEIKYKLTFETNGATSISDQLVLENEKFIEPQTPTKDNFTFNGWYLEPSFNTLYDFNLKATKDLTLYAKFTPINQTDSNVIYEHNFTTLGKDSSFLTFDDKNSTSTNYETYDYKGNTLEQGYKMDSSGKITFTTTEENTKLILVLGRRKTGENNTLVGQSEVKINDFTHIFTEQYIELEITLTNISTYVIQRNSSTSKEFGILFFGLYKNEKDTQKIQVTFDTQGGTQLDNKTIEIGDLLSPPIDPEKPNFDFLGWSMNKDIYIPFNFESQITENITLYAHWAILETYKVTIDGIIYEVKEGKVLPPLSEPVIEGKVFLGYLLDGVTFDLDTPITSDITLTLEYRDALVYELQLELNGGNITGETTFNLYENELLKLPHITKTGFIFVGWFINPELTLPFTQTKLNADTTLYAKFINENDAEAQILHGSYFEAIYATWLDNDASNAEVLYKESNHSTWMSVDKELIRQINATTARVDVVGIKEGYYDIKITTSNQTELNITQIYTNRQDRSGYAHFNYTEGIGAYNDDGLLKENAIVIYVTEQNKNNITIPGIGQTGLGWILNNNQYFSSSSNTHSTQNQLTSLAYFNQPIVFRMIGKITAPEGLTIYNSTNQGGSIGDNGSMARIRNANHITIEGIGEDAEIYGWGIHFMAMNAGRGIGFEAKNLTFRHYPEDAIGLEGVQSGTTLTSPVQRGWIHHVTFYEGYHPNPAESDKANGDGSLDIKRGEYFTISYNQFLGAHKTNLVGSSDSSLQYHITYHHNHWQNNASRIPLARNANIHMYNNIFETTDDNQNEASYAQNTRVNAYIFSEANYFIATKNPSRVDSGAIKSFNEIKYSTYGTDGATIVNDRSQNVVSGNKFENFDTNPNVFYYDEVNKKSNVEHLTDAVTARSEVMIYAGHFKTYQAPTLQKITHIEPIIINDSISQSSTKILKGQPLIVFKILVPAEVEIISSNTSIPPVLVTIYGEVLITGSGKLNIAPGTYVIESSQAHGASKGTSQAKESNAGYVITIDSEEQKQARIDHTNELINSLPSELIYSKTHEELINDAKNAYDNLLDDEKLLVNHTLLTQKINAFNALGKTFIESLINQIGDVNEESFAQINIARKYYDEANVTIKALIDNYQVLINSEELFETFKIDALISSIDDLPNLNEVGLEDLVQIKDLIITYESLLSAYNLLSENDKNLITNIDKLHEGLEELNEMRLAHDIKLFIENLNILEITRQNSSNFVYYYQSYQTLHTKYLVLFTQNHIDKLHEGWSIYEELQGNSYKYIMDSSTNTDNYFTFIGDGAVDMTTSVNIYGNEIRYTSKLNSSASFTFTTKTTNSTLIIVVRTRSIQSGGRLDIDGVIYNLDELYSEDGLAYIEVTLTDAKTYTIKRDNRELVVYYIEVIE